jgi:hypothetical protein
VPWQRGLVVASLPEELRIVRSNPANSRLQTSFVTFAADTFENFVFLNIFPKYVTKQSPKCRKFAHKPKNSPNLVALSSAHLSLVLLKAWGKGTNVENRFSARIQIRA